jgi:hypothetical protein
MENTVAFNPLEEAFYNLSRLGDAICFGLAKVPKNVILSDELIKKSLFFLYKRHPLLRADVKIDVKTNQTSLKYPIDYQYNESNIQFTSYKLEDSNKYTEKIEQFTSKPFEFNDLLWRMMLLELNDKYIIVLAVALYITDGMNICALTIELVNIMNSLLTHTVCEEMNSTLPLVDNVYQMIEKTELFTECDQELLKKMPKRDNVKFLLSPYFRNENDIGFKLNLLAIDRDLSQSIFENAKSKNIKLTGFLATCIIYAFKKLYHENGLEIQEDFSMNLSVSLRIRMDPQVDFCHARYLTLPNQIGLPFSKVDSENSNVWNDSIYANECIAENLNMNTTKTIFNDYMS